MTPKCVSALLSVLTVCVCASGAGGTAGGRRVFTAYHRLEDGGHRVIWQGKLRRGQ